MSQGYVYIFKEWADANFKYAHRLSKCYETTDLARSTLRQVSQTLTGVSQPLITTGFLPREQSSQTPCPHWRHWMKIKKFKSLSFWVHTFFQVLGEELHICGCFVYKYLGNLKSKLTWCNFALGEEFIEEDVDDVVEDELESGTPSKLIWHTQHCKHS